MADADERTGYVGLLKPGYKKSRWDNYLDDIHDTIDRVLEAQNSNNYLTSPSNGVVLSDSGSGTTVNVAAHKAYINGTVYTVAQTSQECTDDDVTHFWVDSDGALQYDDAPPTTGAEWLYLGSAYCADGSVSDVKNCANRVFSAPLVDTLKFQDASGAYHAVFDAPDTWTASATVGIRQPDASPDYLVFENTAATLSGHILDGGGLSGTTTLAGTLDGTAVLSGTVTGGTYSGITLDGTITNSGTIAGGTYSGTRTIAGTSTGGTYSGITLAGTTTIAGTLDGAVVLAGTVTGGAYSGATFAGTTTVGDQLTFDATSASGTITGGTYAGAARTGGSISGTVSGSKVFSGTTNLTGAFQKDSVTFTFPATTGKQITADSTDTLTNKSANASIITAGALVHERGGLEADVSAYNGIAQIKAGVTGEIAQGAGLASRNYARNGCGAVCTVTVPDGWSSYGGATVTQQTGAGYGERGTTSIKVVSDADGGSAQQIVVTTISASENTFLRSRVFTISGRVKASDASNAKLFIGDGVTTYSSAYHTGGGNWEWLTLTFTTHASASNIGVYLGCDGNTKTAYFTDIKLEEGPHASAYSPHPNDEHLKAVHHTVCTQGSEADAKYGMLRTEIYEIIEDDASVAITFQEAFTKLLGWSIGDEAAANAPFVSGESGSGCTVNLTDVGTNYVRAVFWGAD
uniref:Uncharacterized protein n=2 Tax=viral metagenome TaxID=1070528 RepID=A0A6M3IJK0_9ZZZZ